ncbi:PadR family transcriptional regulator [Bdellovibrio sp. HCB274]|uniref:PadR family transcriptional regulator n=1 Tax=Bdellovibrio sp. HCB274 TaxID=3394361 RepID=UPI0039B607EF
MNVQFKKGVIELLVLSLLNKKDRYGYELVEAISESIEIAEGTIYPLLKRMTDEGYFKTYLQESSEGPPRKYYQMTTKGRTYFEELRKEWREFAKSVEKILGE